MYMITGHPEAMAIYGDPATFPENELASGTYSSCNVVCGSFVKFSVPMEGDDVSDIIVRYRNELPFSDQLPSFDPPNHTAHRHLLMRLITPKRLKENEDFMWQFADRLIDGFFEEGSFEMVGSYAEPFTLTVIADLEGVPESDHSLFRERLSTAHKDVGHKPLEFLYERFNEYIEDRRQTPRNDVLTGLATATFPGWLDPRGQGRGTHCRQPVRRRSGDDGATAVVRLADARRAARPAGQRARRPRPDPQLHRGDAPAREPAAHAVPDGPRRAPDSAASTSPPGRRSCSFPVRATATPGCSRSPYEFDIDRPNARQHIAFGHGIHTCAGAPLARAEGRVTINRFLDRTGDITISEEHHGPAGRPPVRLPADLLPPRPASASTSSSRPSAERLAGSGTRQGVDVASLFGGSQRRHDQLRLRVGRPGRRPAVDGQHDAGHLRRAIAGKPDDGVGHVLGLRLPLQRLHVAQNRSHFVGRDAGADMGRASGN